MTYLYWESGDYSLNCAVPLIQASVSCKQLELTYTVYQIWKGNKSSVLGRTTCLKLTARPLRDPFCIGRSNPLYEQSQLFAVILQETAAVLLNQKGKFLHVNYFTNKIQFEISERGERQVVRKCFYLHWHRRQGVPLEHTTSPSESNI